MTSEKHKEWAKQLITYHKNPTTKIELPGNKFFLSTGTEVQIVKDALQNLTRTIHSERVDRRCARAVANWLPSQNQAEVTKASGLLSNFGFANRSGKFLYAEEALYLLETNHLELQWNKVPLSIQQAYEIVLNANTTTIEKYLTYRKLLISGFRLLKEVQFQQQCESLGEPSSKRICIRDSDEISLEEKNNKNKIKNIFDQLKQRGPKRFTVPTDILKYDKKDYRLLLPRNTNRNSPDLKLLIYKDKHLDPLLSLIKEETPRIIGYTNSQFVGYYCMESVNVPDLN